MKKGKSVVLFRNRHGGCHEDQKGWSDEETVLLVQLHATNGKQWKLIARHFPSRTRSSIRSRFYRLQQNIEKDQRPGATGQTCSKCGLRRRGHLCTLGVHLGEGHLAEGHSGGEHLGGGHMPEVFPFPDTLVVDYSKLECNSPTYVESVCFVWSPDDHASLNG